MMPAVMMARVMAMVTRGAMTDRARTVNGLHNTAAWRCDDGGVIVGRIVIIIRVVVVKHAPDEEAMPMPETVMEPASGKARSAGNMADSRATGR